MELQFITHHTDTLSYLDSARLALEGGCRWIQLRMKEAPRPLLEATARQLLPLCSLIVMRRKESRQILGTSAFDTVYLLDDTAVHGLANQTSTTIAYYLATGHTMAEARQKATEYIKIKAP